MKHLVVESIPPVGERIELTGDRFHYIVHVRRVRPGDSLDCTDGRGSKGTLVVVSVAGDSITLETTAVGSATRSDPSRPTSVLSVWIALLKGKKFDHAVRQVTELGATSIHPVVGKNCVSRPALEELNKKRRRWQQIAVEASQQSGRTVVPEVAGAVRSGDVPASNPAVERSIVFHESAPSVLQPTELMPVYDAPGGIDVVAAGDADALRRGARIHAWRALIGPEGGFSPDEIELFERRGWLPRRLDLPVLRAETAIVAATTLIQHARVAHHRAADEASPSDLVHSASSEYTAGSTRNQKR